MDLKQKEKLLEKLKELTFETSKLNYFINGKTFSSLDTNTQGLLREQKDIMIQLKNNLSKQLEIFEGVESNIKSVEIKQKYNF